MTITRAVGQQSRFTATFTTDTGDLDDPISVTFRWKLRDTPGAGTPYRYGVDDEVTRSSVGVYVFTAPVYDDPEKHVLRVESTGLAAAAEELITVTPSSFVAVP